MYSGLADWLSVTSAKGGLSDRPVNHGSFNPGEWLRESATFSFEASYLGGSTVEALDALSMLRGLASSKTLVPMTVDLGDGAYTRFVRLHSIDAGDIHDRAVASVEVYLEAPDPLLYGALVTASTGVPTPGVGIADPLTDPVEEGAPGNLGRASVTNSGSASTSVRIEVSGGLSEGVQIQVMETGEVLRLDRLIPDGSRITFNSRTGRVVIDGQSDVTGFLTVDQWPQVPENSTRTFQFIPLGAQTGTPVLTVDMYPAGF